MLSACRSGLHLLPPPPPFSIDKPVGCFGDRSHLSLTSAKAKDPSPQRQAPVVSLEPVMSLCPSLVPAATGIFDSLTCLLYPTQIPHSSGKAPPPQAPSHTLISPGIRFYFSRCSLILIHLSHLQLSNYCVFGKLSPLHWNVTPRERECLCVFTTVSPGPGRARHLINAPSIFE